MTDLRTLARLLAEDVPDGRFGQPPPRPGPVTAAQAARNRAVLEAALARKPADRDAA